MDPDEFGREEELDRIVKLLDEAPFDASLADEIIKYFERDFSGIKNELLDIKDSVEKLTENSQPNRFVDYKIGWYQDLKGNLYKYDGVVWDVVPGRDTKVEFLG
jgi:hypothetical protein